MTSRSARSISLPAWMTPLPCKPSPSDSATTTSRSAATSCCATWAAPAPPHPHGGQGPPPPLKPPRPRAHGDQEPHHPPHTSPNPPESHPLTGGDGPEGQGVRT